jgi:uncharacterized protein
MNSAFTASAAHAAMTCPKCAGEMRAYERSGVIVDQCRDCRGIFLDRGELEHLVDLEADPGDRREPRGARDDRREEWRDPRRDEPDHRDERDGGRGRHSYDPRTRGASARGDRRDGFESPMDALGDAGELGGLGDLVDPLGRRERTGRDPDPRMRPAARPKKRGGFLKDLLEGFGE